MLEVQELLKIMMKHDEHLKIGAATTLDEPVTETIVLNKFSLFDFEFLEIFCADERSPTSCGQVEGRFTAAWQRKPE